MSQSSPEMAKNDRSVLDGGMHTPQLDDGNLVRNTINSGKGYKKIILEELLEARSKTSWRLKANGKSEAEGREHDWR